MFYHRFVQITRSKLINEGESVKLLCQVDGFPLKTDTIKWERDGYDIGELGNYYLQLISTSIKMAREQLQMENFKISQNMVRFQ